MTTRCAIAIRSSATSAVVWLLSGGNRVRQALLEECARIAQQPLRLLRLIGTLYYQLRLSRLDTELRRGERLFELAGYADRELPPEMLEEMRYFSTTLDELVTTLKEYVPASHILIVRHPHLQNLQKDRDGGAIVNRKVGELVAAAATRNGITFYDAQDELARQSAHNPDQYYWSVTDMHFNFEGMRAYGQLVGREIMRKLEDG